MGSKSESENYTLVNSGEVDSAAKDELKESINVNIMDLTIHYSVTITDD